MKFNSMSVSAARTSTAPTLVTYFHLLPSTFPLSLPTFLLSPSARLEVNYDMTVQAEAGLDSRAGTVDF